MGLLGRLARGARHNAMWNGAGSAAVLGAGFGGATAGIAGGDMGDIGRGALIGGAGGALGATAGIPAAFAAPLAGGIGGLSQTQGDPQANERLLRRMAQDVLRTASQSGAVDDNSLSYALEANRVPEEMREIVATYAMQEAQGQR